MSKVICDVCGTTFPETASQCPICGSARNGSAPTAVDNGGAQAEGGSTYSYVSGGRFSKANVRKRNKTGQPMQRQESAKKDDGSNGSNKGLIIVVVVLLLAIIAVCIYIGVRFFVPESKPTEPIQQTTTQQTQTQTQQPTETETEPTGIACEDIQLSSTIIEFTDMERSQLLSAVLTPVDTTDELIFTSSDTDVATVTDGGLVTPVGPGETTITITCGEIQKECRVVCNFSDETEPTEPEETEPAIGDFALTFNTKYVTSEGVGDVTLGVGQTWRMYATMNVAASEVIWTSDNESVATIKDGVVTVIAPPTKAFILVHAEYAGVKYSCRIRVSGATTSNPAPTTPPATESDQNAGAFTMTFNTKYTTNNGDGDVTLHPGNTWTAYKNISVSPEQATWTSDNPAVCTVADGVVTVVGVGKTMIHAEYNGVKYSCVINVK